MLDRISLGHEPDIDLSFVGQIILSTAFHEQRARILERVADHIDAQIFTPSFEQPVVQYLKHLLRLSAYGTVQLLNSLHIPQSTLSKVPFIAQVATLKCPPCNPVPRKLSRLTKPALYGLKMFQTLRDSKITFNTHIDISSQSASNMRLFEATGVGTCLLTDWKPNLPALFEPNSEVISYDSAEDCLEKITWLLEHPKERAQIATAGQARTLRAHTFSERAPILDSHIHAGLRLTSARKN